MAEIRVLVVLRPGEQPHPFLFDDRLTVGEAARLVAGDLGRGSVAAFTGADLVVLNRDRTLADCGVTEGQILTLVLAGGTV